MSCPYCHDFVYWSEDSYDPENSERVAVDLVGSGYGCGSYVSIGEDGKLVLCDHDEHEDTYRTFAIDIKFCPMCGRRL